jgi:hypothetical protein
VIGLSLGGDQMVVSHFCWSCRKFIKQRCDKWEDRVSFEGVRNNPCVDWERMTFKQRFERCRPRVENRS